MTHQEPLLSVLVLDFLKPDETRACLGSIKSHVKVPYQVIYLHNGPSADNDYPYSLFTEGLVDRFIQTRTNGGLGLGTRDLFAAAFTPYCLYLQNDQQLVRDIDDRTFRALADMLDREVRHDVLPIATVKSVSLAGPVGGRGVYSERAHLIKTAFYKGMEAADILGYGGAGPYHEAQWRERSIQDYYRKHGFVHETSVPSFVQDNGRTAKRQNPDGSIWEHKTDTKELRHHSGAIKERNVYPYFTDDEWTHVLATQSWPEWQIPEREKASSFKVW